MFRFIAIVVFASCFSIVWRTEADAAAFSFDATLYEFYFDEINLDDGTAIGAYTPTGLQTDGSVTFDEYSIGETLSGSLSTSTGPDGLIADLKLGSYGWSTYATQIGGNAFSLGGWNGSWYYVFVANLDGVASLGGFPTPGYSIFYTNDDAWEASDDVYGTFGFQGVNARFRLDNITKVAPVPLPATFPMLVMGIIAFAHLARARRA